MATKKKAKKTAVKKGPRQKELPGMEDRKIRVLDDAALTYAEVRDARMDLTKQEAEAKARVADLMHANKKTHYKHGNILIDLVPEGESVKVKIKPEGSEEDEPDTEIEESDPKPAKKGKKTKSVLPEEIPEAPAAQETGETEDDLEDS
jgi:hypothetical protein